MVHLQEVEELVQTNDTKPPVIHTHPSIYSRVKPASHPENVVLGGRLSPCSPNLEDHFNEDAFNAVYKIDVIPTFKREHSFNCNIRHRKGYFS
nr:putative late blight resistance protein homolog R1B-23 [Ipomoea batatas]